MRLSQRDIESFKQRVAAVKSKKDRAEGTLEQIYSTLQNEFECTSIEDAEKLMKKLEKKAEELEIKIEKTVQHLEDALEDCE